MANEESKKVAENTQVATADQRFAEVANFSGKELDDEFKGVEFTLERLVIPSGGGTSFQKPTLEGIQDLKAIEGTILFNHPAYSYYKDKYDGGKNPPECYSTDGETGVGTPGGKCLACPYNEFGSDGAGKKCKNKRALYIQIPGEMFPYILYLPVGSIKNWNKYLQALLGKGKKPSQMFTRITLERATNETGIAYSRAVFTPVQPLTQNDQEKLAPVQAFIKEYSKKKMSTIMANAAAEDDQPLPFG